MCGIAGCWGHFPEALLVAMSHEIRFRGPDSQGCWFDQTHGIGLAHRRLSIIDLSDAGAQPMIDSRSRVVLSYNGELYNYRQLRDELVDLGQVFHGLSDTEVVLKAYVEWGTECFRRFDGIFALAIWDPRSARLMLARDQMGVKPLYLTTTPRGLLFASELKAFCVAKDLDRTVDSKGVRNHLTYLWSAGPTTMFSSVRKVEPGTCLTFSFHDRLPAEQTFFSLPVVTPSWAGQEEATRGFEIALRAAVERQMVADVPVGAFLSGGLDSSTIVTFARGHTEKPLPCFTVDYAEADAQKEGMVRDLQYAREVAKHLRVDLHEVHVKPASIEALSDMVWTLDEPQADVAPLYVSKIAAAAQELGVKVLLSGAGGDDLLTGYRRHQAIEAEKYWSWIPRGMRARLSRPLASLKTRKPLLRKLKKLAYAFEADGDERLVRYFRWLSPETVDELLGANGDPDPLLGALAELPLRLSGLERALFLESRFFLADHNLNYTDKMSMRYGVEVRVPLIDLEIVRAASRVPMELKQRGTEGKWILKKIMERYLPNQVIYRPKTGFGAPVRQWLLGSLREPFRDILSPSAELGAHVNMGNLRNLVDENESGLVDASYPLLAAMLMELWLKQFTRVPSVTY